MKSGLKLRLNRPPTLSSLRELRVNRRLLRVQNEQQRLPGSINLNRPLQIRLQAAGGETRVGRNVEYRATTATIMLATITGLELMRMP